MPQHKKIKRRRKKTKQIETTIICKVDEEQIVTKIKIEITNNQK